MQYSPKELVLYVWQLAWAFFQHIWKHIWVGLGGICGALGFSWFYQCNNCDVDIHLDFIYDTKEEKDDWNGFYEIFIIEYESKDDHTKMDIITKLLKKVSINNSLKASSSNSKLLPGTWHGMMDKLQNWKLKVAIYVSFLLIIASVVLPLGFGNQLISFS